MGICFIIRIDIISHILCRHPGLHFPDVFYGYTQFPGDHINFILVKPGVRLENGIYGHSRFCNTDFDDKLACLNLSGV